MAEQRSLIEPDLCDYQPPGPPGLFTGCVREPSHDGLHVCAEINLPARSCVLVELTPLADGNATMRPLLRADLKNAAPFDRLDAAALYGWIDSIRAYRAGPRGA